MRAPNKAAIDLIKSFESLRLTAYLDSVRVPTIGYGHTRGVKMGTTITEEQAEALLEEDLAEACRAVETLVRVPLTDNQFGALVSFQFNLGALGKSTLLKFLNKGQYAEAAQEFGKWVYAGREKLNGLIRRREAERKLFCDES